MGPIDAEHRNIDLFTHRKKGRETLRTGVRPASSGCCFWGRERKGLEVPSTVGGNLEKTTRDASSVAQRRKERRNKCPRSRALQRRPRTGIDRHPHWAPLKKKMGFIVLT